MALATLPYLRRPNFRPSDFLIDEKQNEARYVPSSFVPTEIEGNMLRDHARITLKYTTPEDAASRKFKSGNVELELGRSTQKILAISVRYQPNHAGLIAAMDETIKVIGLAKSAIDRPSIRKSYELVISFFVNAKREFSTNLKSQLEEMFRKKTAP